MSAENIEKLMGLALLGELKRRRKLAKQIMRIVVDEFTFSTLAVKRGKVFALFAQRLGMTNNKEFRYLITAALAELGVKATKSKGRRLFRGFHTPVEYEAHLKHEAEKMSRRLRAREEGRPWIIDKAWNKRRWGQE